MTNDNLSTEVEVNRADKLRNFRRNQNKQSDLRNIAENMKRIGIVLADVVEFFESGAADNDTSHRVGQHRQRRENTRQHENNRRKAVEARRAKPKPTSTDR
jgi:hypothetical protein